MELCDHFDPSDAEVIAASLADPEAFAVLFDRYAGRLYRYVAKRIGRENAEDLVGETFAVAFRSRRTYDLRYHDARPWLFGIATNLVRHYWRSQGRHGGLEMSALDVEDGDGSDDVVRRVYFSSHARRIADALVQLDDSYLDVLLLVAGPAFSYEEVSLALGIPIGTVRSRLSRARQQLRELLGDSGQYLGERPQLKAPHCR
jgi:RNA polymerase sigma factor (sigma-70 family)